jgi:hypothetical protein
VRCPAAREGRSRIPSKEKGKDGVRSDAHISAADFAILCAGGARRLPAVTHQLERADTHRSADHREENLEVKARKRLAREQKALLLLLLRHGGTAELLLLEANVVLPSTPADVQLRS